MEIKTGTRQQKHLATAERLKMVEQFRRSGLTRAAFSRQHQIPLATLNWWLKRSPPHNRKIHVHTCFDQLSGDDAMDRRDKLPHSRRGLWIRPPSPAVRALPRVLIRCNMLPTTSAHQLGTLFVRADQVGAMREKVANYKRMQKLVKEWVDLAMEVERRERAAQKHGDRSK